MIDTHCHLDLYPDPTEVANRAYGLNVLTVMVTNLPSAFEKAYPHVTAFPNVRIALGLHPLLADQHKGELSSFERLIDKTSYIGEVGLDFSRDGLPTKKQQLDSFRFVLKTVGNKRKFITVHSRKAEAAILDTLEDVGFGFPIVFHWYSGSFSVLDRAINNGHFFSINPAMTESSNGKKIVERIPPKQILTETDGPFIKRGFKAIEPSDVSVVEDYLARNWLISSVSVREIVRENFMKLVRPIQVMKKINGLKP